MCDEEIQKRLPLPVEIKRLTGIRDEVISEFGIHPSTAYRELEQYCIDRNVDYIVAHNGDNFDRPFLFHELDKLKIEAPRLRSLTWIDTRKDIKYKPGEEPKSKSLQNLLVEKRFIPAIAHRALPDASNMMWLLAHYDINEILEYKKIPWIVVRAMVQFSEKDLAKAQGYSWQEINHKIYDKSWVKLLKENELDAERLKFPEHEVRVVG